MDTEFKSIELEFNSTDNPLIIQLPNYNSLEGVELKAFYYKPSVATTVNFLGVHVEGIRGRFGRNGLQTECLRTIPQKNGVFDYESKEDDDGTQLNNKSNSIKLAFTDREGTGLNSSLIKFNNNYLINLAFLVR
jgi:hypothetical protein